MIMLKFNKDFNLKIAITTASITLLFTNMLYASSFSEYSLRPPVGREFKAMKKVMMDEVDRRNVSLSSNQIVDSGEIKKRFDIARKKSTDILVGFMRDSEWKIQPVFSNSPEFQSIREPRSGFLGSIIMGAGWNPQRRAQVISLSIKNTSFTEPNIYKTENWDFLPKDIQDIFERGSYFVTTQNQESRYSILMHMTPTSEKSRKGRSGVLLKDGLPVIIEINGKEFLIELKGSGITDGGYETTNGTLAGGVTAEFSKREILNLDSRKESISYKEGETIRGAAHILINLNQGYVIRLSPGSFRLSYSQNAAIPHVETQKASFLVGREIAMLLAEGRIPFTHPENFALVNNGENAFITDYSDILQISDLPGNVEGKFYSPIDGVDHALGTIEEIPGYRKNSNICFKSFLEGVVDGYGKVMTLAEYQRQEILNSKDFTDLANILWRQFLFKQYFESRKEKGWIPYSLREKILVVPNYKKSHLDPASGFPAGFLKLVETEISAKKGSIEGLDPILEKTGPNGANIIAASKQEPVLANILVNSPIIISQGEDLLYCLRQHLLSEIELLQNSLNFIADEGLRKEVEYNLIVAIRKFLVLESMSSLQVLQEIASNRNFIVSMYMLPYYSNLSSAIRNDSSISYGNWISNIATQSPQEINLGFSIESVNIATDIPSPLTMDKVEHLWETPQGLQAYKQSLLANRTIVEEFLKKTRELRAGTSYKLMHGIGYLTQFRNPGKYFYRQQLITNNDFDNLFEVARKFKTKIDSAIIHNPDYLYEDKNEWIELSDLIGFIIDDYKQSRDYYLQVTKIQISLVSIPILESQRNLALGYILDGVKRTGDQI